jgi:hypothetical protein
MIVALATSYTGWIIVSISAFHSESVTSESRGLLLPSTWSMHLPTVAALLFFLAPILYGLINTTLPPSVDAIESLQDRFSVRPPRRKVYLSTRGGECDNIPCDTSSLLSYYQNPICDDDGVENNEDYDRIPEICDLDVADINDLLCPAARNVLHSRTRHAR